MSNLLKKRSTLVILATVILVLSSALFIQFREKTGSPVGPSTTSSSTTSSSTATSSAQQKSTSTSSSSANVFIIIGFSQDYSSLFVTPSVTMNYTFTVSQLDTTASPVNVTLSSTSTIPGVTLTLSPKEFTFLGTQEAVDVGISVAPTVNSTTLPVEIIASTANGTASSTFDFILNRNLIVVTPYAEVVPPTLHVSVGQEVTWLNFIGNQAGDPVVTNVALVDGSAASPTMQLNDVWSHTFDKAGTYPYKVTVTGTPTASGVVIVE
jgi:plastocyanin